MFQSFVGETSVVVCDSQNPTVYAVLAANAAAWWENVRDLSLAIAQAGLPVLDGVFL